MVEEVSGGLPLWLLLAFGLAALVFLALGARAAAKALSGKSPEGGPGVPPGGGAG